MNVTHDRDPLVVVTAVGAETRAVLAAVRRARRIAVPGLRAWQAEIEGRRIELVQAGIGPARARTALEALTGPHGLVLSVGFAGALVAGPAPGDVVLPTAIVWDEDGTVRRDPVPVDLWTSAKAHLPPALAARALHGALLSSPAVVASPAAKAAAARRFEAVAVEMEAAALLHVARTRGIAVLPLRAILDTADVSLADLPPDLDASWRASAQLLRRPAAWPGVLALAREIPRATRTLTAVLRRVLPAL